MIEHLEQLDFMTMANAELFYLELFQLNFQGRKKEEKQRERVWETVWPYMWL